MLQAGSEPTETRRGTGMAHGRAAVTKVSCENCFFHQNNLCAISPAIPCATFRPNHPEGLRPPSQMRFVFRQERRMQVAWAFPSAAEQVALHA
jgi:hypothetical protein